MGVRPASLPPAGALDRASADTAAPEADRGISGSVAASLAGKGAEMVTLLLLATVVPRALGPSDYGHFAVPLTIVTLGSLALVLGGPTLMARFVPAAPPEERPALARALGLRLARGRAAQLAVIAALAGVGAAIAPDRLPAGSTTVVVVALALNVVATLLLQTTLGLGRAGAWSSRYPLQNTALIVSVLVLHDRYGRPGGEVAILVAAVVATVFAAAMTLPVVGRRLPAVPIPEGAIRFGVLQAAGAGMTQTAQRGGVLAVAILAAPGPETGYAALALGLALGVTYAVLQAFTVSLPHLHDRPDAEATLRRLAGGLLAVLVPGALGAALFLDRLVPAIFGDDYRASVDAFGPALALVVLAPVGALLVQVSALRLRPEVAALGGAAGLGAFLLAAVLTVPSWAAAGATFAAFAGAAASALVAAASLRGAVGWSVGALSAGGAAAVLALSAVVL